MLKLSTAKYVKAVKIASSELTAILPERAGNNANGKTNKPVTHMTNGKANLLYRSGRY